MSQLSINVEIAGRNYPLNVKPEEEENVRLAAKQINESVERLKANYPMTDMRDLLSMAALQVCTRVLNSAGMADRSEIEAEKLAPVSTEKPGCRLMASVAKKSTLLGASMVLVEKMVVLLELNCFVTPAK